METSEEILNKITTENLYQEAYLGKKENNNIKFKNIDEAQP